MGKNIVKIEKEKTKQLKKVAVINDLPSNTQDLVDISLTISNAAIEQLSDKEFKKITNLKK